MEDLFLLNVLRHVHAANFDQARALRKRQGGMDEQADDLEDDDANPDREGHRQAAHNREARILHEHASADLQVENEGLEAGQAAAIAMGFPGAGNTADPDERLAARFVRCHAGADIVVRVQIDVALQLVGEVPLAGTGPNEAGDSRPPRAQRSHGSIPSLVFARRLPHGVLFELSHTYGLPIRMRRFVLWDCNRNIRSGLEKGCPERIGRTERSGCALGDIQSSLSARRRNSSGTERASRDADP